MVDEDEDSEGEHEDHQIAQVEAAAPTCGPLTPVCVLVIGGSLGTFLIYLSILVNLLISLLVLQIFS